MINTFRILLICLTLSSCLKYDPYKKEADQIEPDQKEEALEPIPDLGVPKTFDWSEVYINITLANNTNINDIHISFPKLKYNKEFAYSYTFDDTPVQAYGKAFTVINQKWVDTEKFYHVGQVPSTGSIPSKTLGYTDGCGNERRFSFGISIWPDGGSIQVDNFMNPTKRKVDKFYPYLVWRDIVPLVDFGCDLYLHDVSSVYDDTLTSNILMGLKAANDSISKNIGRKSKTIARPNNNNLYLTAARGYEDIVFMTAEGLTDIDQPVNISFDKKNELKKAVLYRRYTEPIASVKKLLPYIEDRITTEKYPWIHDFSQAPSDFKYILDLFTTLNNTYGKNGSDQIWFASLDEVYEYNYLADNCLIEKSMSNNILTLRFKCNSIDLPDEFIFHRDFSIIIKGVELAENSKISSGGNVYGISYAKQSNDEILINLDCNKSLLDKAYRYVEIYEKKRDTSSKADALYFVNRLKESLRNGLSPRLD